MGGFLALPGSLLALPWAPPGDPVLRHDLQWLADEGHLRTTLGNWPISWGGVAARLTEPGVDADLGSGTIFGRIESRLDAESQTGLTPLFSGFSAASDPMSLRTFVDQPRENFAISARQGFQSSRFAGQLHATWVEDPSDGEEFRLDGSYIGLGLGNWMLMLEQVDRWWGPGHEGSLILSNNARPIPAITLQRNVSDPFESRYLRWIGPWSLTTFMGRMDDDRVESHDNPLLFGMRIGFSPLDGLDIGLNRTAMWGGEGRPTDLGTFIDLFRGDDNNVDGDNPDEPGNQLAGFDIRYRLPRSLGLPLAVYTQWNGEDEEAFLPEAIMFLHGVETWGSIAGSSLTWRIHAEYADTSVRFLRDSDPRRYNIAYNHSIYRSGYRFEGLTLGHAIDGDGLSYSLGGLLVEGDGDSWGFLARKVEINRESAGTAFDDQIHGVSAVPLEQLEFKLHGERVWGNLRLRWSVFFLEEDFTLSDEKFRHIGGSVSLTFGL